ncbi:hypothetical protein C8A05DRAFT_43591 [Staphylotrichum tortipilum]|uniref:Uncharacterized protein n=1 Tax=Staphylotrichum tortipilum TaxID=2831512 RepID=A0AAN6RU49_9PEZI|nr:hypothetical protein C8A05DRAFT_43591 [Staphylotrichum longicolle]
MRYNPRPASPPGPSLPYRPRPDGPEASTTYPPPQQYPPPPSTYAAPPPGAPAQIPQQQTASSTSTAQPPLSHISPRPITGHPKFSALPPQQQQQQQAVFYPPPPTTALLPNGSPTSSLSLNRARKESEAAIKELISLRRQQTMVNGVGKGDGGQAAAAAAARVSAQMGLVVAGLRGLRGRVGEVVGKAEGQRWRRILVGGVFASIIPLVKKLFRRRSDDDDTSANRTEYAFKKSKGLVARILASTHRPGLGTLAFLVFAVLYVFQNEVSLRVARTVGRRLKRLVAKVEDGREELTDDDVKALRGWRWRVLSWSE